MFVKPLGQGQVPVWKDQNLLQGWPGGLPGEAEGRQAARRMYPHPENHPLLAGPQEVSAQAQCRNHHSEVHPRIPGPLVSSRITTQNS